MWWILGVGGCRQRTGRAWGGEAACLEAGGVGHLEGGLYAGEAPQWARRLGGEQEPARGVGRDSTVSGALKEEVSGMGGILNEEAFSLSAEVSKDGALNAVPPHGRRTCQPQRAALCFFRGWGARGAGTHPTFRAWACRRKAPRRRGCRARRPSVCPPWASRALAPQTWGSPVP